ncbi:MAG: hypothetical protein ACK58J_18715, partial [Planctomyces sp.]
VIVRSYRALCEPFAVYQAAMHGHWTTSRWAGSVDGGEGSELKVFGTNSQTLRTHSPAWQN